MEVAWGRKEWGVSRVSNGFRKTEQGLPMAFGMGAFLWHL